MTNLDDVPDVLPRTDAGASPLRPLSGSLTREKPVLELQAGTWQGKALVTPISGLRGRAAAGARFEVSVSWHGPPLPGNPPLPAGVTAVDATDTLMVGDLELAKAVAMRAIDAIRDGRAPDLRRSLRLLTP